MAVDGVTRRYAQPRHGPPPVTLRHAQPRSKTLRENAPKTLNPGRKRLTPGVAGARNAQPRAKKLNPGRRQSGRRSAPACSTPDRRCSGVPGLFWPAPRSAPGRFRSSPWPTARVYLRGRREGHLRIARPGRWHRRGRARHRRLWPGRGATGHTRRSGGHRRRCHGAGDRRRRDGANGGQRPRRRSGSGRPVSAATDGHVGWMRPRGAARLPRRLSADGPVGGDATFESIAAAGPVRRAAGDGDGPPAGTVPVTARVPVAATSTLGTSTPGTSSPEVEAAGTSGTSTPAGTSTPEGEAAGTSTPEVEAAPTSEVVPPPKAAPPPDDLAGPRAGVVVLLIPAHSVQPPGYVSCHDFGPGRRGCNPPRPIHIPAARREVRLMEVRRTPPDCDRHERRRCRRHRHRRSDVPPGLACGCKPRCETAWRQLQGS